MKKYFKSLFVLLSLVLVMSCDKEEVVLTQAELISKELQAVIVDEDIDRVMNFPVGQSWGNTWVFGDYGKDYKFEGEFVYIEGETYYLNSLIKYQIGEKNSDDKVVRFLLLSFY